MNEFLSIDSLVVFDSNAALKDAIKTKKIEFVNAEIDEENMYHIRDLVNAANTTLESANKITANNLSVLWSFYGINIEIFFDFVESKTNEKIGSERDWSPQCLFSTTLQHLYLQGCVFNYGTKIYTLKDLEKIDLKELMNKLYNGEILILNNNFYDFIENFSLSEDDFNDLLKLEKSKIEIIEKVVNF